jgi:UPF0716 protein FxsA
MAIVLVLLFIVVPLVELYVIIQVGQAIGLIPTLFLLLLDAVLGAWLLRSQGRAAWRRFNEAVAERRMPHREVLDGVLVIIGGALLLTPGFVTDVFGLLLLIPPSRDLIRRFGSLFFFKRVQLGARAAGWGYSRARGRGSRPAADGPATGGFATGGPGGRPGPSPGASPPPRRPSRSYDVEGEAHEIRDESLLDRPEERER